MTALGRGASNRHADVIGRFSGTVSKRRWTLALSIRYLLPRPPPDGFPVVLGQFPPGNLVGVLPRPLELPCEAPLRPPLDLLPVVAALPPPLPPPLLMIGSSRFRQVADDFSRQRKAEAVHSHGGSVCVGANTKPNPWPDEFGRNTAKRLKGLKTTATMRSSGLCSISHFKQAAASARRAVVELRGLE
jgi:hypothetical protein